MGRLTFRAMTTEDADAVAEIEEKSFAMPWKRDDFWREAQNELATYIVGELDGKIVAYAGAWVSFNQAEVMSVAVVPELRGQGVGTILFGELIQAVKARGATAITLEVRPSNTAAIKLYQSFGLKSVGRRRGYYLDNGEDALIMWNTKL
ncbi:MAG: ribosomal protein S18-alanine N-acetyltransferase [Selenomonadaceae bacterium]|nr:ribosomal protein S18-alanine N-acetyltransferase [Selenomonadaceae bacterium]MBQ9497990.1 ribosomal protein S18-alanine N-acetyltransferase [Selenomonadaceae bacterium]